MGEVCASSGPPQDSLSSFTVMWKMLWGCSALRGGGRFLPCPCSGTSAEEQVCHWNAQLCPGVPLNSPPPPQ